MTGTLVPVRTRRPTSLAAGVLLVVFAALTLVVALRTWWVVVDVDGRLANAVRTGLAHDDGLLATTRVLTWLGHPLVVDALVLAAAILLWRRHRPVAAVALVATGLASLLVRTAVKIGVDRARPEGGFSSATGGSFPSGHTAGAAFLAAAAIVLVARAWVVLTATVYVLVVGASRIVLDVHWLSDVVAGLVLGVAFALLLPWAQTWIGERRPRPRGATLPTGSHLSQP